MQSSAARIPRGQKQAGTTPKKSMPVSEAKPDLVI